MDDPFAAYIAKPETATDALTGSSLPPDTSPAANPFAPYIAKPETDPFAAYIAKPQEDPFAAYIAKPEDNPTLSIPEMDIYGSPTKPEPADPFAQYISQPVNPMAAEIQNFPSSESALYATPENQPSFFKRWYDSATEDFYTHDATTGELRKKTSAELQDTVFNNENTGETVLKALARGAASTSADIYRIAGLAADIVNAPQTARDIMNMAAGVEDWADKKFGTNAPRRIEDVNPLDTHSVASYIANGVVEQLPNFAVTLGSGYTGVLAARLLKYAPEAAAMIGAWLGSTAIETGSTAGELYQRTNEVKPVPALIAGTLKGSLDMLFTAGVLRNMGLTESLSNQFVSRLTRRIGDFMKRPAGSFLTEGATEALQELVDTTTMDFVTDNYDALGPEARSRILNSFVMGGIGGAVIGAGVNAYHASRVGTTINPGKLISALSEHRELVEKEFSKVDEARPLSAGETALDIVYTNDGPKDPGFIHGIKLDNNNVFIPTSYLYAAAGMPVYTAAYQTEGGGGKLVIPANINPDRLFKVISDLDTRGITDVANIELVTPEQVALMSEGLTGKPEGLQIRNNSPDGKGTFAFGTEVVNMLRDAQKIITPELAARIFDKERLQINDTGTTGSYAFAPTAISSQDSIATFRHELVHALDISGRFTAEEIELVKQLADNKLLKYFDVENRWADQLNALGTEEQKVASARGEALAEALKSPELLDVNKIYFNRERLLPRIAARFNALLDLGLRGKFPSYTNFGSLLDAFSRGEISQRPPGVGNSFIQTIYTPRWLSQPPSAQERKVASQWKAWYKFALILPEIAYFNRHLEPLQRYQSLVDLYENYYQGWAARAATVLENWNNVGEKLAAGINQYLFALNAMDYLAATRGNVFQIRDENGTIIKEFKREKEMRAWWSDNKDNFREVTQPGFFKTIAKERWPSRYEEVRLQKEAGIYDNFNASKVADSVVDLFEAFRKEMRNVEEQIVKESVAKMTDKDLAKVIYDTRMKVIADKHDAWAKRPYFPLMRFGRYVVIVRDKEGKLEHVEHYDRERARNQAYRQLQQEFPADEHLIYTKDLAELNNDLRDLNSHGFLDFADTLATRLKLDDSQKIILKEIALDKLPGRSFLQNMMQRRRFIRGYSQEGRRALATYFNGGSRALAKMKYADQLTKAIDDLRETPKGVGHVDPVEKSKIDNIANFMSYHLRNSVLHTDSRMWWARKMAYFNFIWGNVSTAMFNLSALPIVTYNHMASVFGDATAVASLGLAVSTVHNWFTKDITNRDPFFQFVFDQAMKDGHIAQNLVVDLVAAQEAPNLWSRIGLKNSKVERTVEGITRLGGLPMQVTEQIIRWTTLVAEADAAIHNLSNKEVVASNQANKVKIDKLVSEGVDPLYARAYTFAVQSVFDTQARYGPAYRRRMFTGWGTLPGALLHYPASMIFYMFNKPGGIRMLLTTLALAGVSGLPFGNDINDFIKFLLRSLGRIGLRSDVATVDPMFEARRVITELSGEPSWGALAIHGFGRLAPVDVGPRVGFGTLIPGIRPLSRLPIVGDDQRANTLMQFVEEVGGAGASLPFSIARSIFDREPDDLQTAGRFSPAGFRNLLTSVQWIRDQGIRARQGDMMYTLNPADPSDLALIVAKGIGFTPSVVSEMYEMRAVDKETQDYWRGRKTAILAQWDWAIGHKLPTDDLRKAVSDFNTELPKELKGLSITSEGLAQSLKQRAITQTLREQGYGSSKATAPFSKDLEQFFLIEKTK